MDIARKTRRPWRSWTVIALVLVGLALAQACGKSGSSTGPSTNTALQLNLRRAGGALLPASCTGGTFVITAPGYPPLSGPLQGGQISVSLTVGLTYTITVSGITCAGIPGTLAGSTTFTVLPGGVTSEIVITVSQVLGVSCSPSTVAPNQASTCTCDASSLGNPITWTGPVNPKTGKTVTFKESNPGTYQVACTIVGIDTKQTAVTVQQPEAPPPPPPPTTGTIEIFNEFGLALRRKGLAEHSTCSFCEIFTRVIGVPGTTRQIEKEHSATVTVPPGSYSVEGSCNSGFDGTFPGTPPTVTVGAGQEVDVFFFGHCED
jgi:hypothetical protein